MFKNQAYGLDKKNKIIIKNDCIPWVKQKNDFFIQNHPLIDLGPINI